MLKIGIDTARTQRIFNVQLRNQTVTLNTGKIMKDQWNETLEEISDEMLSNFEFSCEWDFETFKDICADHDANPAEALFGHCINMARLKWEAIKLNTKKEIASHDA